MATLAAGSNPAMLGQGVTRFVPTLHCKEFYNLHTRSIISLHCKSITLDDGSRLFRRFVAVPGYQTQKGFCELYYYRGT